VKSILTKASIALCFVILVATQTMALKAKMETKISDTSKQHKKNASATHRVLWNMDSRLRGNDGRREERQNTSLTGDKAMNIPPNDVIQFWFSTDPKNPLQNQMSWWKKDSAFDKDIKQRFGATLTQAVNGELDHWLDTPEGTLAFIILLDQFSRNIYRNTPKAWAQDSLALTTARDAIKHGFDKKLSITERMFFYMPLMHSENLSTQDESIAQFTQLANDGDASIKEAIDGNLSYAHAHRDIIAKFGRYPHRNKILRRESTKEEIEFLKQPNSSF